MSLTPNSWEKFTAESRRLGLELILSSPISPLAATPADPLFKAVGDGAVPRGATHLVVLLQTGANYWEHLRNLRNRDPELDAHADPLDTLSRRLSLRLSTLLGEAHQGSEFPFASSLNFVALGQRMGAGLPSRLRVLIHPVYGTWITFRMLFYIRDSRGVLPTTPPIAVDACNGCPAPCIPACPAGAFVGKAGAEQLDYPMSFRYRKDHGGTCADACAARVACPVGAEHRYPADSLAHSHHRAFAMGVQHLAGDLAPVKAKGPNQGRLF